MGKLKKFIINGLLLTATSLLLRWVGVVYNSFLSNAVGSEGMGVYSLVMSVFGFAVTFACSGINLGTTRLVSEALACNNGNEVKKSIKLCISYSLIFSLTASIIMFLCCEYIGKNVLNDIRTVSSIRILSFSLPFISLASVFSGYFSAVRRVYKNATSLILEQTVQILLTSQILLNYSGKGVEFACNAVAFGVLISEVTSLLFNGVMYIIDTKKHTTNIGKVSAGLSNKLLGISLPLALSTYVRSGLVTVEHLLIPYGLRKNGASYTSSMSTYGVIQGMVFPLIMFPSCLVYSFGGLIVPELSALNKQGKQNQINHAVSKVLHYAVIYSVGVAGIMTCYAYELSYVFYKSAEAYPFIRILSPLIAIMYLDGAVDGVLKGLNEQIHSMKINIIDAAVSIILVWVLVPKFGLNGYIATVFVCEIVNCALSLTRLTKVSSPYISISKNLFLPIFNIIMSTAAVTLLFDRLNITFLNSYTNLAIRIIMNLLLYFVLFPTENLLKAKYKAIKKTFP